MLRYYLAGMPDALRKLMQINTAILREISFQVSEGNPHWGLLLANEYLDANGHLHAALFSKFLARFGASYASHPLAKRLKAGARAAELPKYLREQIGERAHRSDKRGSYCRAETLRSLEALKLAVRCRCAHSPRCVLDRLAYRPIRSMHAESYR